MRVFPPNQKGYMYLYVFIVCLPLALDGSGGKTYNERKPPPPGLAQEISFEKDCAGILFFTGIEKMIFPGTGGAEKSLQR